MFKEEYRGILKLNGRFENDKPKQINSKLQIYQTRNLTIYLSFIIPKPRGKYQKTIKKGTKPMFVYVVIPIPIRCLCIITGVHAFIT
jgi:hypothetical protein